MMTTLPVCPPEVCNAEGLPLFGRYAGTPQRIDWQTLHHEYRRNAWWQKLHHKHWHYVGIVTDDLFCGVAIVDVGWISTAFAYVYDRRRQCMLADLSQDGWPGVSPPFSAEPDSGSAAGFLRGPAQLFWQAEAKTYRLQVRWKQLSIDAVLDGSAAAPALTAIARPEGGTVHATCKSAALTLRGDIRVGDQRFDLQGGVASFDRSNGFLARETAWRWASAHRPGLGFNLQAGYLGAQENALWLNGELIPLAAAYFRFDPADKLKPWQISTEDGLLELEFIPEACRAENKNLLIAASRYVQPVGTFHGWVKASANASPVRVDALAGVTEDHFSRW